MLVHQVLKVTLDCPDRTVVMVHKVLRVKRVSLVLAYRVKRETRVRLDRPDKDKRKNLKSRSSNIRLIRPELEETREIE